MKKFIALFQFDLQDMHDVRNGIINLFLALALGFLFIFTFKSAWSILVGSIGLGIFCAAMVRGKGWDQSKKAFVYFFLIGGVLSSLAYWLLP